MLPFRYDNQKSAAARVSTLQTQNEQLDDILVIGIRVYPLRKGCLISPNTIFPLPKQLISQPLVKRK